MQEIIAHDEYGNSLTNLVQWDSDVYVYLSAEYIDSAYRVHFFNNSMEKSLVVESQYSDGILKAKIPNYLLTQPYIIFGYVSVVKNEGVKSLYSFKINVRKKPKPSSYISDGCQEWIEVETLIDEVHSFAKVTEQYANKAENSANLSESYYLWSKSYAIGEGGKRDNEEEENSKYYYEKSKEETDIATGAANEAEKSANKSEDYYLLAKSYSMGEGGKRDNEKTDNAKYYCEKSKENVDIATDAAKDTAALVDEAEKIAENIKNLSRWTNTIIDDVTAHSYFIGIENGVVYFSDEFE